MCGPISKSTKLSKSKSCIATEQKCPCKCPTHLFGLDPRKPRRKKTYRINSRLQYLSTPRNPRKKFQRKPVEKFKRHIEIVREDKTPTRIKQLAIPKVRKLVSNRDHVNKNAPKWTKRFNNLIKKSMLTMYSCLNKAKMPPTEQKMKSWTQEDWNRHNEWLKVRAQPRQQFEYVPEEPKRVPLKDLMEKINQLSKPRNIQPKHIFDVNPLSMELPKKEIVPEIKKDGTYKFKRVYFKKFEARQKAEVPMEPPKWSQNIQELAKPKNPRTQKGPTPRTSEVVLREPTEKQIANSTKLATITRLPGETFDSPKPISQFALKAKTPEHIVNLAKPKEIEHEEVRSFPLKISKAALKAEIKDRTLELSKPNKPITIKFAKAPKEDFYSVKPTALTYVASEKVLALSKPKLPIRKKIQMRNTYC